MEKTRETRHDSAHAHDESEGTKLVALHTESVTKGASCTEKAKVRRYNIVAINVDITINRYLDHDPEGRMFVLEQDLPRVREEEKRNAAARAGEGEPAVSLGLQTDAIQPLTLRVNKGECLRVRLNNNLKDDEPASFHVHGSSLLVTGGRAAIATNPKSIARRGKPVMYEWMVHSDEQEGTHYFHSHGNDREQTSHGLFGAVIVEPTASRCLEALMERECTSGWAARILVPHENPFREFVLFYHEIGNEKYQLLSKTGELIPLVDPILGAYRPGSRALNYRSEPFMNRMQLQKSLTGAFDESVAYSSYSFGDPATPIMRAYLGDRVKERIVHGGSEVFHVHHVHGGSIRWRRQPSAEGAGPQGLNKHPPLVPTASERTDSQSIGPSETFDAENECGAGGCQQSVGDYLFHCHVAHHYFAGMWGIWRVYNTKQDGVASTDSLPPLLDLPAANRPSAPAVSSEQLIGSTVDWQGRKFTIDESTLAAWVGRQLPPKGLAKGYDASVLDWDRRGNVYLGEMEEGRTWPGYKSHDPGTRPPLAFDPQTGKLAYPFLRPHLGKRPPFAPNHGPAPFLDPTDPGSDPPAPGASGKSSLCPNGTQLKHFAINAVTVPIPISRRSKIVDPAGEIYVLREQENALLSDDRLKTPLAIRANAGEDCVDVVLRSELEDTPENHNFAKVNLHIHFVQFDIQASDGVVTGFNYEQSIRPFKVEGEKLSGDSSEGANQVTLGSAERFQAGTEVGVGMDKDAEFEIRRVTGISGNTLTFDRPLEHKHQKDSVVSSEFVRYRWYPDVQFGTAYFHDHVNALASWRHGLFGALVSEPPGSTYHDPHTGQQLQSGALADVYTEARSTLDVTGSFRELVMFIQDHNPINAVGRSSGSSINLRAAPLEERGKDPPLLFSNGAGDPETPILESYLGDPLVVRTLVGGTNDVHTWHVDGHWFRAEPFSATSPPIDTINVGISERYDLYIPAAGGPQHIPGDYLYYSGRSFKLREGSWGLIRVFSGSDAGLLRKLPGREAIPASSTRVCPSDAPLRTFDLSAIETPLPMLDSGKGKIFVLKANEDQVVSRKIHPEPLVLHVSVGDCLEMHLTNKTTGPVSLHPDMLSFDPSDSAGVAAGREPPQYAGPGESRTYTWYASPEVGETAALIRDFSDVSKNPGLGLYGAVIVGPRGALYSKANGGGVSVQGSSRVDVLTRGGSTYRDFTLFLQDEDAAIGTHRMPYSAQVDGVVGINYSKAPLAVRLTANPDTSKVFDASIHHDPATPLLQANVGDDVRIHILVPWSEQAHVFSVEGHEWAVETERMDSDLVSSIQVGGLDSMTLRLVAGGRGGLPGDYLYGDHREPYREAGMWGLFRVRCSGQSHIRPPRGHRSLPGSCPPRSTSRLLYGAGAVGVFALAFSILRVRRKKPSTSKNARVKTPV